MIESADLPFVDVILTPLAVALWNDTRQLFRPTARVGIREQRRPISTGRRARSIGVPSSAITTRNCPRYRRQEIHFNSGQERARSWQASLVLDFAREFL